jgi:hypothetical protein
MNFSIKRILFSFLLGLIFAALAAEISYALLKKENRAPGVIELVIPTGTGELVNAGEAPPDIPNDMRFVVGDTLKVINQDDADHQLGPLWIPAKTTATLKLDKEDNFLYECTFQVGSYMGVTVQEPVTWRTRVSGMFFAGFPLGMLFAVYSGLIGSKKKERS